MGNADKEESTPPAITTNEFSLADMYVPAFNYALQQELNKDLDGFIRNNPLKKPDAKDKILHALQTGLIITASATPAITAIGINPTSGVAQAANIAQGIKTSLANAKDELKKEQSEQIERITLNTTQRLIEEWNANRGNFRSQAIRNYLHDINTTSGGQALTQEEAKILGDAISGIDLSNPAQVTARYFQAVRNKENKLVELALKYNFISVNATTPGGNTGLGLALATGNEELVKIYLSHGADVAQGMVTLPNGNKIKVLDYAILHGELADPSPEKQSIVQTLIANGATISQELVKKLELAGTTPVHYLGRTGDDSDKTMDKDTVKTILDWVDKPKSYMVQNTIPSDRIQEAANLFAAGVTKGTPGAPAGKFPQSESVQRS